MKRLLVFTHNLILFIPAAIYYGIPPWRWVTAWRVVQAGHLAEVRKIVWELKCQGRVYEDSEGRLWVKDKY